MVSLFCERDDILGDRETKLALLKLHIQEYYAYEKKIPPARRRVARKLWLLRVRQRWAAEEFLGYLKKSSCEDLCFTAEQFAKMMDDITCREHGDVKIFSTAYDVATDLIDYLYSL